MAADAAIISKQDGDPVEAVNLDGESDIVLICEHAANRIPRALGDLGLDAETLQSHIAWDPGAAELARQMSDLLDAPLFLQRFSRLVYDCNRPLDTESAVPPRSEVYDVPGNAGLSEAERKARQEAVYLPFRDTVSAFIRKRIAAGRPPAVITVHTFTPVYLGQQRDTELGILHDADARLADAILSLMAGANDLQVARNQPYGPEDGVTHTLKVQALGHGLPNVMFEIRNDLVADAAQQRAMAERLSNATTTALATLSRWFGVGADRQKLNASSGG